MDKNNRPVYTIDTSSLIRLFNPALKSYYKGIFTSLWEDLEQMFKDGIIISHIQVLEEIKNGSKDELQDWAKANSHFFRQDVQVEAPIINTIGAEISFPFVNAKDKPAHADPWLVAQAKSQNLSLINDEAINSNLQPQNYKIYNVCVQPQIKVESIPLFDLVLKEGWSY